MHMSALVDEFGYAHEYTHSTRQWYRSRLGAFTNWLASQGVDSAEGITTPLVRRYLESVRARNVDSFTLHGHARAVRALLSWSTSEGILPAVRVVMPKREQKVLSVFTHAETDAILAACARSAYPERDRAIVAVLLDTGIRASELCGLTMDRVFFTQDDAYLVVRGKGSKQREVGLGKRSRMLLHKYVHRSRGDVASGPVFIGRTGTALTPLGLDRLLRRLAKLGGVTGRVSAHRWRHTYAYRYIAAGGDLFRLARLLGHSSVTVTQGYLSAFSAREARRGYSVLDGETRDGERRSIAGPLSDRGRVTR